MKAFSKRLLTMLLAAAMVFSLSGMTAFAAEEDTSEGDISTYAAGEEPTLNDEGYYELSEPEHLVWFADQVDNESNRGINGILTKDIDVSNLEDFSPIGVSSTNTAYTGIFDGAGHTITLNLNNPDDNYQALFGYTNGATISDVKVEGSVTGYRYVAGIIAYMYGGNITGCVNDATVTSGYNSCGGVVGYFNAASSTAAIADCGNDGAVTSSANDVGGIAGYAYATGNYTPRFSGCYNHAAIEGTYAVGGIVGLSATTSAEINIDSCYNTGAITSTVKSSSNGQFSAGLLGVFNGASSHMNVVSNSFNMGTVTCSASAAIGALVGGTNSTMASNTQLTLDHAYYLEGSAESYYAPDSKQSMTIVTDNEGNPTVTSKTAEEMESIDFLDLVNANLAFTQGEGHPILKWETDDRSPYMLLKEEYDEDLKLDWADWTTESWEAFEKVMEEAGALLDDSSATDEELTNMLKALQDAKEDLVYIEPDYTLKYAVSIYDINKDVDEAGHTLGLTWGPATGSESYVRSYKAHLTQEEYESGEKGVCIHWMTWREIVRLCKEDPEAFRNCLNNGCSASIKVNMNDTLLNPNYEFVRMIGDGCGIFEYSLRSTYLSAAFSGSQHNYSEMSWRTTLNTASYSLLSCFPEDLQEGIAAKKLSYPVTAGSSTVDYCYDKLWIFGLYELGAGGSATEGTQYYRPYSTNANNSPDNRTYKYWNCYETGEWGSWSTRSHYGEYDRSLFSIYYHYDTDLREYTYGTVSGGTVGGLSPGFCLAGPDTAGELSAFAVYSADDSSLTFYTDYYVPAKGDTYDDKAVTAVYADVDETAAESAGDIPWSDICTDVTDVVIDYTFADAQPTSTAYWFDGFESASFTGLSYMDTTDVTSMSYMFQDCSAVTGLDLSDWDTKSVTDGVEFATGCTDLQWVKIGEDTNIFTLSQNVDQQYWYDSPEDGKLVSNNYLQNVTEAGQYWTYEPEGVEVSGVTLTAESEGFDDTYTKAYNGEGVTLTVDAVVIPDDAQVTYEWYYKGPGEDDFALLEETTENTRTLAGNVADSGTYQCVVKATSGGESATGTSNDITITITQAEQVIEFTEESVTAAYESTFTNELTDKTVLFEAPVYESSDESVAKVDPATGEVTIVGVGSATITATAGGTENYSEASESYTVTGTDEKLAVTVAPDAVEKVYDGASVTLTAEADSAVDGATFTYEWYKNEEKISNAAEDSTLTLAGDVSDTGSYTCKVTVSYPNDVTGEVTSDAVTVTITQADQKVAFEEDTVTAAVKDTVTNELTGDSVVVGALTYESSDTSVATVDADGTVTIVGVGSATITATAAATENYKEADGDYTVTGTDTGLAVTVSSNVEGNEKDYDAEPVILSAEAVSLVDGATFTYQWYKEDGNGSYEPVGSATDVDTLTLPGRVSDSGSYTCEVTVTYPNEQTATITSDAIAITIEKAAQNLSYEETTVEKQEYDEPFVNDLTRAPAYGKVTYESKDADVATVDPDSGEVTIRGTGTTTITATAAESDDYYGATASYDLIVSEAAIDSEIDVDGNEAEWDEDNKEWVDDVTYTGEPIVLAMALHLTDEEQEEVAQIGFQWYRYVPDTGEYEEIAGATDSTYTLEGEAVNAGEYVYQCVAVITYNNGYAHTVTSSPIEVNIAKAAQEISFAESSVTKTVGDEPFANELIETTVDTAGGAYITYTSSDETIATVDETGQVTILAEGEVTITATVSATANYAEASASYALTIEAAPEPTPPVDKTALEKAIADAESLDADKYTEDSWSALETALAAAKTVDAEESATQDEVDKALDALENAINGLVEKTPADKEVLETTIANAEALKKDDYTEESWNAMQTALDAAKTVAADEDATQSEVDQATIDLVTAIASLESSGEEPGTETDKSDLLKEYTEAMSLSESDYTTESWEPFAQALATARSVLTDPDATQNDVDAAEQALKTAMDNLKPAVTPADKSKLEAEYEADRELSESDYTPKTWAPFEEALANAELVLADADATQEEVDEALNALQTARKDLEPAVDKEPLEKEVDEVEAQISGLNKADYTDESWSALESALAAAKAVDADESATQEDVDKALEALQTARAGLTKKPSSTVKNGLCQITPGELWGYYVNNEVDTSYTGFAHNDNGDWWVVDGYVKFDVNSVEKDTLGKNGDKGVSDKGIWWYVIGNKVQHNFTGLANYKNANGWWYIKSGQVDFSRNSVDKNNNGWYYVLGGKVRFDFTGLADYKNANGWWYIAGGKVDFTHNGVDKNKNGWYYVLGGKVRFDYTGVSNYSNKNGWWYIAGGKVDFSFTGRASNKNGTWNVVNGKVVF